MLENIHWTLRLSSSERPLFTKWCTTFDSAPSNGKQCEFFVDLNILAKLPITGLFGMRHRESTWIGIHSHRCMDTVKHFSDLNGKMDKSVCVEDKRHVCGILGYNMEMIQRVTVCMLHARVVQMKYRVRVTEEIILWWKWCTDSSLSNMLKVKIIRPIQYAYIHKQNNNNNNGQLWLSVWTLVSKWMKLCVWV